MSGVEKQVLILEKQRLQYSILPLDSQGIGLLSHQEFCHQFEAKNGEDRRFRHHRQRRGGF